MHIEAGSLFTGELLEALITVAILGTLLFLGYYISRAIGWQWARVLNREMADRIGHLENQVASLQHDIAEYQRQINIMQDRIDFLVTELMRRAGPAPEAIAVPPELHLRDEILVVVGQDLPELRIDLASFRKVEVQTGLRFKRLIAPTPLKVERMLERGRASGNPVRYMHISAHAGPAGIALNDTVVDGEWMSQHLRDVEALVIAGCESEQIGDLLGVVPFVVTMLEAVDSEDARLFGEAFWAEIGRGKKPLDAYYAALQRCPPAISEFSQVHV